MLHDQFVQWVPWRQLKKLTVNVSPPQQTYRIMSGNSSTAQSRNSACSLLSTCVLVERKGGFSAEILSIDFVWHCILDHGAGEGLGDARYFDIDSDSFCMFSSIPVHSPAVDSTAYHEILAHSSRQASIPQEVLDRVEASHLGIFCCWAPQQYILGHNVRKAARLLVFRLSTHETGNQLVCLALRAELDVRSTPCGRSYVSITCHLVDRLSTESNGLLGYAGLSVETRSSMR